MRRTDSPGPEQVVGGRYRLQDEVGRGGMAGVWRAYDLHLDRTAAVKVLDPVWRADPVVLERFRQEARSAAGLAHRHIVGVYDFHVTGDTAYLVMELVDGHTVSELLIEHGPMPVGQAVAIAAQACDALGAAHAAGVVHRDIKPSNLLVDPAGLVKVCDFGLARMRTAPSLTATGTLVGTSHYMSPEQALGEAVDGRSDLYAVGCLLYMMLTGAPPFTGDNPIDVLDLHLYEPPVPLRTYRPDIPAALQTLVDELLAKERADRPATAWSVRDRLAAMNLDPPLAALWATGGNPGGPTAHDTVKTGRPLADPVTAPIDRPVSGPDRRATGWLAGLLGGARGHR